MSDDEDALPSTTIPETLSLRAAECAISEADRAEARAIEEMAYGFQPRTEEEIMLAGQMALTNRAGIAAMMRGYLGADRRGDFEAMDVAVKLETLSLRQLDALNKQRTLRRLRTPSLSSAPKAPGKIAARPAKKTRKR